MAEDKKASFDIRYATCYLNILLSDANSSFPNVRFEACRLTFGWLITSKTVFGPAGLIKKIELFKKRSS